MKTTPHEQLAAIAGLNFADCVAYFGSKATARDKQIVALAKQKREREGDLEIDDHFAITSEGDENGSYVLAWVWVDFAGTPLDKEAGVVHLETMAAEGTALCGAEGDEIDLQLAEIGANAVEPSLNDPEAGTVLCEVCLSVWRTMQTAIAHGRQS